MLHYFYGVSENHTPIAMAGSMALSLTPGILGPSSRASGSLLILPPVIGSSGSFEIIGSSLPARSGVLSSFGMICRSVCSAVACVLVSELNTVVET